MDTWVWILIIAAAVESDDWLVNAVSEGAGALGSSV